MTQNTQRLSRLMRISWDIQRRKKSNRSKSLHAAWVIVGNEDVTILYLTRKLNHDRPLKERATNQFALFS